VTQNTASTTPPSITINGDNPAIIQVGNSYADLGATVSDTGPGQAADTNLGYKTFLNGTLASNIVIGHIAGCHRHHRLRRHRQRRQHRHEHENRHHRSDLGKSAELRASGAFRGVSKLRAALKNLPSAL
jgi:hypothetical protein